MATSNVPSSFQNFDEAVDYALSRLEMTHICLKQEQKLAIRAMLERKDVFVFLPTGYGKSICFQILPFLFDFQLGLAGAGEKKSTVLVVSPLIALMVDQVKSLRSRKIDAVVISRVGGIAKEYCATKESLQSASIIFSSPEALSHSKWRDAVESSAVSSRVCAVVVDEAHCVSKWSKDFRPAFRRLAEIRALVPAGTPLMACTATASRSVKKEVIDILEMSGCVEVTASPNRPNIYYDVKTRTDVDADFGSLIDTLRERGIHTPRVLIYCQSLDMCADLYAHFHFELGEASYYPSGSPHLSDFRLFGMFHADTPQHNKDIILKSLLIPDGVVRVVFATIALGMGINLQDVNTVVHYGAPRSIEDYFQESGRGGRSGGDAVSTVYWKPVDCPARQNPATLRDHELIAVRRYLENITVCRRKWLLDYFDVQICANQDSRCCDICSNETP